MSVFNTTNVEVKFGNEIITFEYGRFAMQAAGSICVRWGDTMVLVTVTSQPCTTPRDFFPLTCNYMEMSYASGRIPGNYFRREVGRPSDNETLISRLLDRPIRPLFPDNFCDEVQIIATVISSDGEHSSDILAMLGASAALHISELPFLGPIGAVRIGYIDGQFVLNPTTNFREKSTLNLVMAASRDAVVMVEGGAEFLTEEIMSDALDWGHKEIQKFLDAQEELRKKIGKPKIVLPVAEKDTELEEIIRNFTYPKFEQVLFIPEKMDRKTAKNSVISELMILLADKFTNTPERYKDLSGILKKLEKEVVRQHIKSKKTRIDGRNLTTVRPLTMELEVLPRAHGSSIFARGETKALCCVTLGSSRDEQRLDTMDGDYTKKFMLHYNFPPYSVGEVRQLRGPSRREVGHGHLAERALTPVMPSPDDFPFTIRVVSEILESNGSSSMATVCGGCLALMDAGVPIKTPIAGIAMGLIKEDDEFIILTDILGDEDHLGDMDFKVAGSETGISAIQMDIKIAGLPMEVMHRALVQAKEARLHILSQMNNVLAAPRETLSKYAPQYDTIRISQDKIKDIIGPGGRNIKAITAAYEASIEIEDDGSIYIFAPSMEALEKTREMILSYDQKAEIGKTYDGLVKTVVDFGAFIELMPGLEGLCHISQLARERVNAVQDVVRVGDKIKIKVIGVDPVNGKVKLSRAAVLAEEAGEEFDLEKAMGGGRRPSGDRNRR